MLNILLFLSFWQRLIDIFEITNLHENDLRRKSANKRTKRDVILRSVLTFLGFEKSCRHLITLSEIITLSCHKHKIWHNHKTIFQIIFCMFCCILYANKVVQKIKINKKVILQSKHSVDWKHWKNRSLIHEWGIWTLLRFRKSCLTFSVQVLTKLLVFFKFLLFEVC